MKRLAALLLAALLLASCGTNIDPPPIAETQATDAPPVQEPFPVSFDGETFDHAPAAVVSLSPAVSEMICDLGAFTSLVAASDYCDFEPVSQLPKAGSPAAPDVETVISLSPDLVISQSPIAATDRILMEQAGIRVLSLPEPQTFAGLCENYIKLAMLFYGGTGSENTASAVLAGIDAAMTEAQNAGISTTFVVVEAEAPEGLRLSPGGTLPADMLSVYGENLWEDSEVFTADEDALFVLAPETVFYSDELDEDDIEDAFPHSKLIPIDFERFERPTVRLAGVMSEITSRLAG